MACVGAAFQALGRVAGFLHILWLDLRQLVRIEDSGVELRLFGSQVDTDDRLGVGPDEQVMDQVGRRLLPAGWQGWSPVQAWSSGKMQVHSAMRQPISPTSASRYYRAAGPQVYWRRDEKPQRARGQRL